MIRNYFWGSDRKLSILDDLRSYRTTSELYNPNMRNLRNRHRLGCAHVDPAKCIIKRERNPIKIHSLDIRGYNLKNRSINWRSAVCDTDLLGYSENLYQIVDSIPLIGYIDHKDLSRLESTRRIKNDFDKITLYKIHDELTDKKLLGTITLEEENQLDRIRSEIESNTVDEGFVELYKYKINAYQELLRELKDLNKLLSKQPHEKVKTRK